MRTKLLAPIIRSDPVARPRLTKRLAQTLHHQLTLISAPAGYGKTTLLAQWIAKSTCPVAWVSLDSRDNDPMHFWRYFVGALQRLRPESCAEAATLLGLATGPLLEPFFSALTNALAAEPNELAIVLDDYNVIVNPDVQSGVSYLLEHLPPNVHLIIATRSDPPLPLAKLRVGGRLNELRAADLSFTTEEAAAFLSETMRLQLSAEDIGRLSKRCEGWIAGLQVAALSLQQSEDAHGFIEAYSGRHQHIVDFLMEEVFSHQPQNVQQFLLQTCILDRLNSTLCEAVSGLARGEGQAMLEALERANFFVVPLDNERQWYRYHTLFASCLKSELQQKNAALVADLNRRACAWHVEHGLVIEAVGHAFAADDVELAARLIEGLAGRMMMDRGEASTLLGWLRRVPDEVIRSRPMLCGWYASALAWIGQLRASEEWLERAERGLDTTEGASVREATGTEVDSAAAQRIKNFILSRRADFAAYRRDTVLALTLSQAIVDGEAENAHQRGQQRFGLGWDRFWAGDVVGAAEVLSEVVMERQLHGDASGLMVASQLAELQAVQGHLHQAAATCEQALRWAKQQGSAHLPHSARPRLILGRVYLEWNDLALAKQHATDAIEMADRGGLTTVLGFCKSFMARVQQAEGDVAGAQNAMSEGLALVQRLCGEDDVALARMEMYQTRLWLIQGNVDAAARWAEKSGLSANDNIDVSREGVHVTLARVLIAQGRAAEAELLTERLLQAAESAGRIGSSIRILALRALALRALGRTNEALTSLARALSLAEPEGYLRTFIDEGVPMAALLSKLIKARHHIEPLPSGQRASADYLQTLLSSFDAGAAASPGAAKHPLPVSSLLEPLSERELAVLRLTYAGHSPSEIACDLVVSKNTVKSHLKSIYAKLDAHSSIEAAAKARILNIV